MQLELNTETLPSIYHISWLLRLPFKQFPKPHGARLQSGEGGWYRESSVSWVSCWEGCDGNAGGFLLFVGRRKTLMLITASFLALGPPEFIFRGFLSKVCLHALFPPTGSQLLCFSVFFVVSKTVFTWWTRGLRAFTTPDWMLCSVPKAWDLWHHPVSALCHTTFYCTVVGGSDHTK